MTVLDKILHEVLANDKSLLSRRDELIAALEEKVPGNLRRDFAPIKKAISLNVGEKFLVGEQDKDKTKEEVAEILKSSGMQAARIDFVVETFAKALDWYTPMIPVIEETETVEEEPLEEFTPQEVSEPINLTKPAPVQKETAPAIIKEEISNEEPRLKEQPPVKTLPRNRKDKIFTTEGRLNRKAYFFKGLKLLVIAIIGGLLVEFMIGIPILIATTVGSWLIAIRRLHDLNKSGWWLLVSFIPYINIVFCLYILFAPGTPGENKYGADPLTE